MRFLAWHLGLGDAIAFAGLAVRIAKGERLVVPCWERNLVSVQSLFVHHANIEVVIIQRDADMLQQDAPTIRLGHYSGIPRNPGEGMHEWVYRTAGEDVATRFDDHTVREACMAVVQKGDEVITSGLHQPLHLIHQDRERCFNIDPRKHGPAWWEGVASPTNDGVTILSWATLIERAAVIHCIDSSFLHLVEQLQPTGKLYYHKYARPGSEAHRLRHNWIVLE